MYSKIKLIAFDLDGTLTQHKTQLSSEYAELLHKLSKKYKLLMVGAGMCHRIFAQMNNFPIDIIGNYGMQWAEYDESKQDINITVDEKAFCDKESIEKRINGLRKKYGYTEYVGDNVEFHSSGCVTFPLLGTKADIADKLAFDSDRTKRRSFYDDVKATFPEYTVFVGGSSSFDMAPKPYNKYYAIDKYCQENDLLHSEVAFVGDDYGIGGNDESVYLSDFTFIKIDNYKEFGKIIEPLIEKK